MLTLHRYGFQNLLSQQRWKNKCVLLLYWRSKERNDQVSIGVWSHQPCNQFCRRGVSPELPRVRNDHVGQAMLVVDGNNRQAHPMSDMASQRLEVGNHEVNLPVRD